MRPVVTAPLSALGASPPIILDVNHSPFNVSVAVVLSAAANLTYTVEHTYDDVFANNFDPSTATWFPHASMTTKTASADANYTYPVRAVRLSLVSPYTSGSATMTVVQAGMPGR